MCFTIDQTNEICGFLLQKEFNTFVYCCKNCHSEFDAGPSLEIHVLEQHQDNKQNIIANEQIFVDILSNQDIKPCIESVFVKDDDGSANEFEPVADGYLVKNEPIVINEVVINDDEPSNGNDDFHWEHSSDDSAEAKIEQRASKRRRKASAKNEINHSVKNAEVKVERQEKKLKDTTAKTEKNKITKRKWKPNPLAAFECEICPGVVYNHKGNLRQHMNRHINEKKQKLCTICNIKPRNFDKHMKLKHGNDRPYKCDVCDAAFKQNLNLVIHMRVHSGEMPFMCSTCGQSFRSTSSRYRHEMRTHEKRRNHECDQCGRRFFNPHQLKEHINAIHLKLRLFKCNICGNDYATSKYLNSHKKTHGEKTKKCRYCDKMFILCENRLKHERQVHKAV